MTLYFPGKVIAHINVNWLSPVKVRTTLIGGEKRMIVWNDLEADEKVKVYDKGVKITSQEGVYELLVSYRSGDMWSPQLEQAEALRQELSCPTLRSALPPDRNHSTTEMRGCASFACLRQPVNLYREKEPWFAYESGFFSFN